MSTLTVTGRSDVASVAADLDDVSRSAAGLDDAVGRVDDTARRSGAGLAAVGEAGDEVASKASQATGAMGALAGGLDAVGATGAAGALGAVAIATDVASGAGDVLNLVAETSVGRWVASTAASIAHRTATIAGSIATGAMTAAQTALNVVMAANPIVLVVIALVALTAAVVLAYRNSETFRNIVDGAFSRAREVVTAAADAVASIVGWFRDLPGVVREAAGDVAAKVESMFAPVGDAIKSVGDLVSDLISKPRDAAATVAGFFKGMFAPIEDAIDFVSDLIDRISDIDFPDINPFGRVASPGGGNDDLLARLVSLLATLRPNLSFTITGALDPSAVAAQILAILDDYAQTTGLPEWSALP